TLTLPNCWINEDGNNRKRVGWQIGLFTFASSLWSFYTLLLVSIARIGVLQSWDYLLHVPCCFFVCISFLPMWRSISFFLVRTLPTMMISTATPRIMTRTRCSPGGW